MRGRSGKVMITRKGEVGLEQLLDELRPYSGEFGAIVIFMGVVRSLGCNGSKVRKLSYECYEEVAIESMERVRREVMEEFKGVKEILINHVVDDLEPGEEIMHVLVAAEHRDEAFRAAREAVERVKREVQIWKKEITEKGEHWISYKGPLT